MMHNAVRQQGMRAKLLTRTSVLLERRSKQKLARQRMSEAVPKRVEDQTLGMPTAIAPIYEVFGQMEPSELPSKRGTIQRSKPGTT